MKMNPIAEFNRKKKKNINAQGKRKDLVKLGTDFVIKTAPLNYSYNFSWLGRPIIQLPQDIIAMQELIWQVKPDLIIETGIAHGGSIIFSASMMELLNNNGHVIGIDIDIRKPNKVEIIKHPMFKRITMIEGSSIDLNVINKVKTIAKKYQKVMVFLDSCHSEDHVYNELLLYSPLVTLNSYIVVFDTIVNKFPRHYFKNRPWDKNDNPMTALTKFVKINHNFKSNVDIDNKLLISVAPKGYLKRIK